MQVSPLYQAAVEALQALSQSDLDEMRHYRTPPDGVVMVMDVMCMLFNRPCDWDSRKQLLVQSSFQVKKKTHTEPYEAIIVLRFV